MLAALATFIAVFLARIIKDFLSDKRVEAVISEKVKAEKEGRKRFQEIIDAQVETAADTSSDDELLKRLRDNGVI